jgi:hypothetical protein
VSGNRGVRALRMSKVRWRAWEGSMFCRDAALVERGPQV